MKRNKMSDKKRLRQEEAIKRLTKTVASHEASIELTTSILEDHTAKGERSWPIEKVEKIRQRKLQSAKDTIANTKKRMV